MVICLRPPPLLGFCLGWDSNPHLSQPHTVCIYCTLTRGRRRGGVESDRALYQERAVFGKMKMDPAKWAQTQNAGEV